MATLRLPYAQVELLAVGLDVDGVLRNTAYSAYIALCKTVEELGGTTPSFDRFVRDYESDFHAYYRQCGVLNLEQVCSVYTRHIGTTEENAFPFADVKSFLTHLECLDIKVFVVSSHPAEKLHDWFTAHNIDDHILRVYGGSRNKRTCIKNACEDIGVDPKSACYVGDWGLDMRAAKAAGLTPIGITRGYTSRAGLMLSGAACVVDHLDELVCLIKNQHDWEGA